VRQKNLRSTSQVQRDYDKDVGKYDEARYGSPGGQYVDKKETEFVSSIIKGSTVLEVGTATGRFAASLTQRGAEYTGVDVSQNMLRKTLERTNHSGNLIQMDASHLGFRSWFDYVLCIRTFHFLPNATEALRGMFMALKPGGECLVTFETDNCLRRTLLFFRMGTSEQYYYKISDVENMLRKSGFKIGRSGSVMRIPVTAYRKCPRLLVPILKRLERLWPWPMHDYVLGEK
jgi:ubiquinone/menaquinone biosynthesis C-methylase UbiE